MARTKRGVVSRAKHNKVLKSVKGQRGRRKNTIRVARPSDGESDAICLQR
jgi:large subunit ribosomal protein L20